VREVAEGVADGEGDAAAEGAETGEFHGIEEIADEVGVDAEGGIGACFGEEFLAAGAAETAGEAFAAGFVGGELEEVFEVGDHGHGFGDADDAGVAEELISAGKTAEALIEFEAIAAALPADKLATIPQVWYPLLQLRLASQAGLPEAERDWSGVDGLLDSLAASANGRYFAPSPAQALIMLWLMRFMVLRCVLSPRPTAPARGRGGMR
jgi:hypothetical protein